MARKSRPASPQARRNRGPNVQGGIVVQERKPRWRMPAPVEQSAPPEVAAPDHTPAPLPTPADAAAPEPTPARTGKAPGRSPGRTTLAVYEAVQARRFGPADRSALAEKLQVRKHSLETEAYRLEARGILRKVPAKFEFEVLRTPEGDAMLAPDSPPGAAPAPVEAPVRRGKPEGLIYGRVTLAIHQAVQARRFGPPDRKALAEELQIPRKSLESIAYKLAERGILRKVPGKFEFEVLLTPQGDPLPQADSAPTAAAEPTKARAPRAPAAAPAPPTAPVAVEASAPAPLLFADAFVETWLRTGADYVEGLIRRRRRLAPFGKQTQRALDVLDAHFRSQEPSVARRWSDLKVQIVALAQGPEGASGSQDE